MSLRRVVVSAAQRSQRPLQALPWRVHARASFHSSAVAVAPSETEKALQEAHALQIAAMNYKDVKKALQGIVDEDTGRTTIPIDFHVEQDVLFAQIPGVPSTAEAEELSAYVAREKHRKDFSDYEAIERLFYYHVVQGNSERAFIDYYDYKFHAQPPKLMCQLMMLLSGLKRDHKTLNNVFADINNIKYLKWSKTALTVGIKAFAQFGDVQRMLQCYYKLYEFGHLPERLHWEVMLKGAAIAGDYRHFSRFYYRLLHKGVDAKPLLPELFKEWGTHENFTWKLSKECNTQLYDVAFAMLIALEVRNYRRAFQFIDDLGKMNIKVTPQIYETLLKKARKHFPELGADCRQWVLRMKGDYKPLSEEVDKEMRTFLKRIREYIGEENLENAPLGAPVPKPPRRISRKKARILNGTLDPAKLKQIWKSKHSDDSRIYEYVPDFKRRLDELNAKETQKVVETEAKEEIDAEIEEARRKFAEWKTVGFEGEFSYGAAPEPTKEPGIDEL